MNMPVEIEAYLDACNPLTPEPGANRSHVYRHCFEVRRREMAGNHWTAMEARARAIKAYEADGLPVPYLPKGYTVH